MAKKEQFVNSDETSFMDKNFNLILMIVIGFVLLTTLGVFFYIFVSSNSPNNIEIGKSSKINVNDKSYFVIDNKEHVLVLNKINFGGVNIGIDDKSFNLSQSSQSAIDYDSDNKTDIMFNLEKIENNSITFIINSINNNIYSNNTNSTNNNPNNSSINNVDNIDSTSDDNVNSNNSNVNIYAEKGRCISLGGKNCFSNQVCGGETVVAVDNPKCCLSYCKINFETQKTEPCLAKSGQIAMEICDSNCTECKCSTNSTLTKSQNWTNKICLTDPGKKSASWVELKNLSICPIGEFNYSCRCGGYECGKVTNNKYYNYCSNDICESKNNCYKNLDCDDEVACTIDSCVFIQGNVGYCNHLDNSTC